MGLIVSHWYGMRRISVAIILDPFNFTTQEDCFGIKFLIDLSKIVEIEIVLRC